MKIMVTGGNGFIGKHVVQELVLRGDEVISLDITSPKTKLDSVEYVKCSVMDSFTLTRHMKGCYGVIHLAAILGVKRADAELLRTMEINVQGTVKVLEACVLANVKQILAVSSSEVYGDVNKGKISEGSPFNPKSGYAVSKLSVERYLEGFYKQYGLNYQIVRFFNVYGPGQVSEFVIPKFIKFVQAGRIPQIYGDGNQTRAFCYVTDAVRGLADLFMCPNAVNSDFNVGNDLEEITIKKVAKLVIKLCGANMEPEMIPFEKSDRAHKREIFNRVPNISKIKEIIQFQPKISLEEGIREIIKSGDMPDSWE